MEAVEAVEEAVVGIGYAAVKDIPSDDTDVYLEGLVGMAFGREGIAGVDEVVGTAVVANAGIVMGEVVEAAAAVVGTACLIFVGLQA